jgi:phosphohistidine phosphatase SixA
MMRASLHNDGCTPECSDNCRLFHYSWLTEAGERQQFSLPMWNDLTGSTPQRILESVVRRTRQKLGRLEASIETIGE